MNIFSCFKYTPNTYALCKPRFSWMFGERWVIFWAERVKRMEQVEREE